MRKLPAYLIAATAAFCLPAVHAQEVTGGDELDGVELEVMEADETPEEAVSQIALPEDASATGVERSAFGVQTANDARAGGAEFGRAMADQQREAAAERGRDAAGNARNGDYQPEVPSRP